MTIEDFHSWKESIAFAHHCMQHTPVAYQRGLAATPDKINAFDPHAAKLLLQARKAYDELAAYLATGYVPQ